MISIPSCAERPWLGCATVMREYETRCAVCVFEPGDLLDAAHIVSDAVGGEFMGDAGCGPFVGPTQGFEPATICARAFLSAHSASESPSPRTLGKSVVAASERLSMSGWMD